MVPNVRKGRAWWHFPTWHFKFRDGCCDYDARQSQIIQQWNPFTAQKDAWLFLCVFAHVYWCSCQRRPRAAGMTSQRDRQAGRLTCEEGEKAEADLKAFSVCPLGWCQHRPIKTGRFKRSSSEETSFKTTQKVKLVETHVQKNAYFISQVQLLKLHCLICQKDLFSSREETLTGTDVLSSYLFCFMSKPRTSWFLSPF